jgi:hypothetical protein
MPKKKSQFKKPYFIVGTVIGLAVILLILELTNTTHLFHKQAVPSVIPAHQNPVATSQNAPSSSSAQSGGSAGSSSLAPSKVAATDHNLLSPTGNFVSNHFPGQNGSTTAEVSTCNTSPQAACYIKFTNLGSGESTQLPSQITDARGSTSWSWDVSKDAHLTSGQWQVEAIATLGDQIKSATDSLRLTIQ